MQSTALRSSDFETRADTNAVEVTVTWGRGGDVIAQRRVARGARVVLGERGDVALPIERTELIAEEMEKTFGDFVVTMRGVERHDELKPSLLAAIAEGATSSIGASALAHGLLAAAFAFFLPGMSNADDADISREQLLQMKAFMTSAAERETPPPDTNESGEAQASDPSGGQRAQGSEGAMGRNDAPAAAKGHWAAQGDTPREDAKLQHERDKREAEKFGMIGLLLDSSPSDPNAPTVPWESVLAGADKVSAAGNMWTGDIGDAFGWGVGVSGTGEGGGGKGIGIGINDIGGLGDSLSNHVGNGVCNDAHCSGHGSGRLPGGHQSRGPEMRQPQDFEVGGHLPKEVIQRIVRQNAGRYRVCYETAVQKNPGLHGRVEVKFMIGRDGSVTMAQDGGSSDMPDMEVRSCVVKAFYSLSFPNPGAGTVKVSYPLVFVPGE